MIDHLYSTGQKLGYHEVSFEITTQVGVGFYHTGVRIGDMVRL
jgi:hypothetical protein